MIHPHTDEATIQRIRQAIAILPAMNKAQLLGIWQGTFETPPPPKLRKELMVPILSYRMQEKEFGGLSHAARTKLQALIAQNRSAHGRGAKPAVTEPASRLIRSWKGEIHEVLVMSTGYVYRGKNYKALSPIAKQITGTPWSGPAFFGTRSKDLKK